MIYVTDDDTAEIEYYIGLSSVGEHAMFPRDVVKYAIGVQESDSFEWAEAESYVETLVGIPGLVGKRKYLAALDKMSQIRVAKIWLNIVENEIRKSGVHH